MKKGMLIVCIVMAAIGGYGDVINFSLSSSPAIDSGSTYYGFNEAGRGVKDTFCIGVQALINSFDGTNVMVSPTAAFCAELQQDVYLSTYNYTLEPLSALSSGTAGTAGTASSGIPVGGIGSQRAAYVNYLFDRYYTSESLSKWTTSNVQAFQLAVWELTHDTDFNLRNKSGNIWIQVQGDTFKDSAIALADSMLFDVKTAGVSSGYTSTNFNIMALTNPNNQDIIFAYERGSATGKTLEGVGMIPEPATIGFMGFGLLGLLIVRRMTTY